MDFSGKKGAIIGFGTEGTSVAKFLLSKGAEVLISDVRPKEKFDKEKVAELENKGVKFQFDSYPKTFSDFDFVVRSPGIRLSSNIVQKAISEGKEVTSAIKIFFDIAPGKIIGVTGTKGKGTTSSLIYSMLKKQGYDAYLGGNIGVSPLDFVNALKSDSWTVLELSSFQLQDLTKSPQISVFLMVTSEHLDYHRDINEYVDAKRNILRFQKESDFAVLNRDYPASNESDIYTQGEVYFVSREREVEKGCYFRDGAIWLKDKGEEKKIIYVDDIVIPGKHNYENVCASSMAAYLAGVTIANIATVLREFKGLEHRLELVATLKGVNYYDDSFSTTPETAIAAIEAFEAPEILILGGSSKNSDFTELGKTIREAKNIKAIIGIGEEWPRIKKEIGNLPQVKFIEDCVNMEEIVTSAQKVAEVGDEVLLSPACASFDMFSNYKDRGNKFKREVTKLSN